MTTAAEKVAVRENPAKAAPMAVTTGAEKPGEKSAEKSADKNLEKRRALGRGLESLLPSSVAPRSMSASGGTPTAVPLRENRAWSTQPSHDNRRDSPSAPAETATAGSSTNETATSAAPPASHAAHPSQAQAHAAAPSSAPHTAALAEVHAMAQAARPRGPEVVQLALDQIVSNPHQTRTFYTPEELENLAESIRASGVLQPVMVRPGPDGNYVLIVGERRCRASKLAGKTTVPAIVRQVSEQQAAEMTIIENLQRQDLNCVEQANAFAKLSRQFGLTQEQIGKRVGLSRESVSNYMRLLRLPPKVMQYLERGELGFGEAKLLLQFDDNQVIEKIAEQAVKQGLSGDGVERLCQLAWMKEQPKEPASGNARWVDPNVRAAQRQLEEALGLRVRIADRRGKGKITIEYGSVDDYERVVAMLGGK